MAKQKNNTELKKTKADKEKELSDIDTKIKTFHAQAQRVLANLQHEKSEIVGAIKMIDILIKQEGGK